MEGLTRLMKNALDSSLFKCFKVSEVVSYSVVQFADDNLIIGDCNWDNICALKPFL